MLVPHMTRSHVPSPAIGQRTAESRRSAPLDAGGRDRMPARRTRFGPGHTSHPVRAYRTPRWILPPGLSRTSPPVRFPDRKKTDGAYGLSDSCHWENAAPLCGRAVPRNRASKSDSGVSEAARTETRASPGVRRPARARAPFRAACTSGSSARQSSGTRRGNGRTSES